MYVCMYEMMCCGITEENYDEATMVQQREIENKVRYFLLMSIIIYW